MTEATPTPANDTNAKTPATSRGTMEKTYRSATRALDKTRDSAVQTARRTADSLESSPVALLAGGIALGAVLGALIPRSAREGELLAPVGKRITDTAKNAVTAARDAGKAELDTLGLNKDAARDQAGKIVGGVLRALATAGSAAASSTKTKQ